MLINGRETSEALRGNPCPTRVYSAWSSQTGAQQGAGNYSEEGQSLQTPLPPRGGWCVALRHKGSSRHGGCGKQGLPKYTKEQSVPEIGERER